MKLVAALLLLLAPSLSPQDKPKGGEPLVRCIPCQNQGRIPCPEHEKDEMAFEDDVVYCSFLADCKVCGGTGWLDCKDCENPKWVTALTKKLSQIASTGSSLAKYDKDMGRKLRKCATDHFVLVWEIDELKIDKRAVQSHELMHVYAKRLERLYADYIAAMHATARELRDRTEVFVWWLPKDQIDASNRYAGQSSPRGIKLLGANSVYSVCGNKQQFQGDEELHRNIVHSVAHLLLAHQTPSLWIGNIKGGWADEGLAHWFEDRYFGVCDNFCYQEQNTNITYKEGKWKPAVRKMVASGDVPAVGEVMSKNSDGLEPPMHAVAFSYVDYLLQLDGAKFNSLCRQLRQKVASRDAMQAAFGMGLIDFEAKWKAWVLETYPVR